MFQNTNLKLECIDTEQDIIKLPPPYIFGEGIRGKNKKNATCLDYKARLVGRVCGEGCDRSSALDIAVRARLYSGPCLSLTLRTKSNTPYHMGKL